MHDGAFAYPLLDSVGSLLHLFSLGHTVQQVHYLACGDEQIVHRVQILSDEAHWHSQGGTQVSNQGGTQVSNQGGTQVSNQGGDTHSHSILLCPITCAARSTWEWRHF